MATTNDLSYEMQGAALMLQTPQQGYPPPPPGPVDMESPPSPNEIAKEIVNRSDSGIFSCTTNTTVDQTDSSKTFDSGDNRSDCSSPERKYFCPICEKMLTSQHKFTLHIRSHNNENEVQDAEKGYTCRICSKVLSSNSSLDRHVLVHSGERPFHCKYCGDTFTTNGNMHRHMRTHSQRNESSYESDGSIDSGSSKSTEFNNNKVEKNKRKNDASVESSDKKPRLDLDPNVSESFQCPICERSDFNSSVNLEAHLEDNHPGYPIKCQICKETFANTKLLDVHKSVTHDNVANKQPVIGFKDLTFVDFSSEKFPHIARSECERNLHKVSTGLKFQCKHCNRAFPCSNSLNIHENNCISPVSRKDAEINSISQPDIRRMEFFNRLNLVDNSPEKPTLTSFTSNKLREHLARAVDNTKDLADIQSILSNINLQKLQTDQNDQATTKQNLDSSFEYQKTEEEESQDIFAVEFRKMKLRGEFPCRLCTAVFPNLRALKGHNRAHLNGSNNGTYHCNMCPHSSIDKAALIRHMRTHNGDRPYECALCNYAFTTKANCERHLRNRHAKTTREEVKKSIIYHPSEDPTNEELNKLVCKDDNKKLPTPTEEKVPFITPKFSELIHPSPNKMKQNIYADLPLQKPTKPFNEIIRTDHLRSIKVPSEISTFPSDIPNKIQVKDISYLKNSYDNDSEEEYLEEEEEEDEQPLNLVLDLSKKRAPEKTEDVVDEEPQDLTKKNCAPIHQHVPSNMNPLFTQQLLNTPPKIDPAALYAAQIALYRSGLPLPNWAGFSLNPLLFSMPPPLPPNATQELKERMQRFQLGGGSIISNENLQNLQQRPFPISSPYSNGFNGFRVEPKAEMLLENNFSTPKKTEDLKPLSLSIEPNFHENLNKLQSPIPANKPDLMHSPNAVKMVIKNGVLMPKQKQRRYRTERPFTCEHCSARFTLRSNMERHIKQQHPQYWSQRQRSSIGTPGKKTQVGIKSNYCDLSIPSPNYDFCKYQKFEDTKELINEKLKYSLLSQQLSRGEYKNEDDEDCALVIDENEDKPDLKTEGNSHAKEDATDTKIVKTEESPDLVPVARLLDNASQQQFKEFFKREGEDHEVGLVSEEDEEGLVASGSTSEGNISGTDENKSESEIAQPTKKKSAYSLAPNRVSCPYCSRKFPWTSSLRRHILTHTGQKPFKCSHCPLLFTTKSNCDRHLLRKHGNAATTIPNDIHNNTSYLMRNVPERPFKCSSCPSSTFSTYSNLKKHISCKHSTNAQGDDIKAQGYEAGSSEDEKLPKTEWEKPTVYKLSESIQNSDLPYKCHLCEGSFSERQDALNHIKDKHTSEFDLLMSKNALECNPPTVEDQTQIDDEDLEARGKFPDYSNRKVICAFCMRRFWSAEDLRRHMRTHTGERPFSCDICKRRFTLKHSMLRHRKKHNVNFEQDANISDEEGNNGSSPSYTKSEVNFPQKTDESDGAEGVDLISNLLGLRDRSIIDKVLAASADDAAKLLGVKNGVRE